VLFVSFVDDLQIFYIGFGAGVFNQRDKFGELVVFYGKEKVGITAD